MSRVIDQLVETDLAAREPHPEDRRQVLVSLTSAGTELVERFQRLDGAISTRMVAGFDAADAHRLADYLDRLAANATALAHELEDDPDRLEQFR